MAAVEVAGCWSGPVRQVIDGAAVGMAGLISMLVIVVTEVLCLRAGLVPAIARYRCPAELEWQKGKQEDGEATTHGGSVAATGLRRCGQGCALGGGRSAFPVTLAAPDLQALPDSKPCAAR